MKKLWFTSGLVLLLLGYAFFKNKVDTRMVERRQEIDIRYLPSPKTARFLSAGFKSAAADMFWIEALNYYGSELANKKRTYQYMPQYLEVILALDPLFNMFYEWASTIAIYNLVPIDRNSVVTAVKYANLGIENLSKVGRYDSSIISKGAFNFALEAHDYQNSLPYFSLAGRTFGSARDLLLVGSTYARYAELDSIANDLKLEYLGFMAFEAQSAADLRYALQVLSSPNFNRDATNIVRQIRVGMEKDEELKRMVKSRLNDGLFVLPAQDNERDFVGNPKLRRILEVDISRNWLPPTFHLLLML